jgi:hypothetical protein
VFQPTSGRLLFTLLPMPVSTTLGMQWLSMEGTAVSDSFGVFANEGRETLDADFSNISLSEINYRSLLATSLSI